MIMMDPRTVAVSSMTVVQTVAKIIWQVSILGWPIISSTLFHSRWKPSYPQETPELRPNSVRHRSVRIL